MAYDHGVYVQELDTSLIAPIKGTAGLQVIFGTAPINMTDEPDDAVNKPIVCYTFAEAVRNFGYSDAFDKYTLCQSMDACFRVFNVAPIILVNVLDPKNSNHITQVAGTDMAVTNRQVLVSDGGDPVFGILKASVVVKAAGGSGDPYIEDVDYVLTFNSYGHLMITLLSTGAAASAGNLNIAYTMLNPEGVTVADIIGGTNAETGEETGMELVRQIYPRYGMTPGLLLAPGWSHNANVAAVLQAKCEAINGVFSCETIIDIDSSSLGATGSSPTSAVLYSEVKPAKENLGINSNRAIACWPMAKVGDKQYYMSALMGALIAYTDAQNSDVPNLSPSNYPMRITAVVLADGKEVLLDQEQANLLNSYGVVTALNYNGFKSWGNNTAGYPSTTDPKDRWIAIRRFFSWWGNSFILTYFQKVDKPANYRLIESIVDSENIRGNSYVARGYCAQAHIFFLPDENPVTDILNGNIKFHMHLSPYTPAEKIELLLEFNPTAIEIALTGGEQ